MSVAALLAAWEAKNKGSTEEEDRQKFLNDLLRVKIRSDDDDCTMTYLQLTAQSPKNLIALESVALVRHDQRHSPHPRRVEVCVIQNS